MLFAISLIILDTSDTLPDVAVPCTSGAQVINQADALSDGIIISGYKLSDNMIYSELCEYKPKSFELLLVACSCDSHVIFSPSTVHSAASCGFAIHIVSHTSTGQQNIRKVYASSNSNLAVSTCLALCLTYLEYSILFVLISVTTILTVVEPTSIPTLIHPQFFCISPVITSA